MSAKIEKIMSHDLDSYFWLSCRIGLCDFTSDSLWRITSFFIHLLHWQNLDLIDISWDLSTLKYSRFP